MADEDGWKELRVRLDPSYHQKLVKLKMLRQKTMSEAIHEALAHYFADVLPEHGRNATTTADDADDDLAHSAP